MSSFRICIIKWRLDLTEFRVNIGRTWSPRDRSRWREPVTTRHSTSHILCPHSVHLILKESNVVLCCIIYKANRKQITSRGHCELPTALIPLLILPPGMKKKSMDPHNGKPRGPSGDLRDLRSVTDTCVKEGVNEPRDVCGLVTINLGSRSFYGHLFP